MQEKLELASPSSRTQINHHPSLYEIQCLRPITCLGWEVMTVHWGKSMPTQVSQLSLYWGSGYELVGLLSHWSQEISWVGLFAPLELASATGEQPHPPSVEQ